ncbi:alpha amylase, partial [Bifidobacterium sp. DSM 109960]
TKGAKVKVAFTDGRSWDDNGGKYYYATGSSMAVAGGQFIGDVTPVCAAEEMPDVPVTSVTLSGTGVSSGKASIKKGASLQLTATVNPSNATDKTVTWKSSNTAVATVSNGKVTGVKAGTATITAKAGDKTASVAVTVTDTPSGLTIVGSTHSVAPETMQFTVSGLPDNANANWIEWSVTGDHLRATNNLGRTFKVFGTAATTGVVTVSYLDQTASVPITVDAYSYESAPTITVDKQSLNMKVGDSVKINYTISPASNPFKLAVFDSFNDDVVFADGDGTLHATGTGSTTVRVWSSRSTNYTDIKVTVS